MCSRRGSISGSPIPGQAGRRFLGLHCQRSRRASFRDAYARLGQQAVSGPGESFHTNHRRPILQLIADTCGVHDLLTAACDEHRYRLYGVQGDHPSCVGNLRQVMRAHVPDRIYVPQPVNLFMNVTVFPDGRVETGVNPSKPGDFVVFKAWIDCICRNLRLPAGIQSRRRLVSQRLHVAIYEAAELEPRFDASTINQGPQEEGKS